MLITCTKCEKKIRAPDSAAGKRVKCPACATILQLPDADDEGGGARPESKAISKRPLPPPTPIEPFEEDEETEGTKVTASKPISIGAKASSKTPKKPRSIDDEDEDDRDEDDEPEDDEPRRGRRRDADDDDYDVRRRVGPGPSGMATASMVLGIIAVSCGAIGLCCCTILFEPIAGICGILAIAFGIMGKAPGSEGQTTTGIICGAIGLVLALLGVVLMLFVFGLQFGMMNMNQPQRRRF